MSERKVILNLIKTDWLTIEATGSILSQVDEDMSYPSDVILELALRTFIQIVDNREDDEVINYFAYYAKLYKTNQEEKMIRAITLPDSLIYSCNKLCQIINGIFMSRFPTLIFNFDVLTTAAVFDYRDRHYKEQAKKISLKLSEHIKRPIKRTNISLVLLQQDCQIIEFIQLCVSYFLPKVRLEDLISLALFEWLKRNLRRDIKDVSNDIENKKHKFKEKPANTLFRILKISRTKERRNLYVRHDIANGLFFLLSQILEYDPDCNISFIVAEAIQYFKKGFVLESGITALNKIGKKRYRVI